MSRCTHDRQHVPDCVLDLTVGKLWIVVSYSASENLITVDEPRLIRHECWANYPLIIAPRSQVVDCMGHAEQVSQLGCDLFGPILAGSWAAFFEKGESRLSIMIPEFPLCAHLLGRICCVKRDFNDWKFDHGVSLGKGSDNPTKSLVSQSC